MIAESYMTSFKLICKKNLINSASSFMNLNDILIKNHHSNFMNITKYNNSSICFNYKTYSQYNDYKYNNIYLIMNKKNYLINYNFRIFNDEYKFLFYINAFEKNPNRTIWNLKIKYNRLFINNKIENDKFIYKYVHKCINKKNNHNFHPLLLNLFK